MKMSSSRKGAGAFAQTEQHKEMKNLKQEGDYVHTAPKEWPVSLPTSIET